MTGEPILAPFELAFLRGPKRLAEDFDAYRRKWTGKLRGRIVLFTPAQQTAPREDALFKRQTDADLAKMAGAPEPAVSLRAARLEDIEWPQGEEAVFALFNAMPEAMLDQLIARYDELSLERSKFLRDEGVAAVLQADARAREGLLAGEAAGSYHARIRWRPRRSSSRPSTTTGSCGSSRTRSHRASGSRSRPRHRPPMSKAGTSSRRFPARRRPPRS